LAFGFIGSEISEATLFESAKNHLEKRLEIDLKILSIDLLEEKNGGQTRVYNVDFEQIK